MDEKDVSYSFVSIRSQQQSKNISYTFAPADLFGQSAGVIRTVLK